MKNKWLVFLTGCLTLWMVSCLSDKEESFDYTITNCQINSLSVRNDSITPLLAKTKFTIDQLNGYIFNLDSLPYGTKLSRKLFTSLGFASLTSVAKADAYPSATGDTITFTSGSVSTNDTIDFSKPVTILVKSVDGVTTKEYLAWINIHQVQPDSIAWAKIGNPLTGQKYVEQKTIYVDNANYYIFGKNASDATYSLSVGKALAAEKWITTPLVGLPAVGLKIDQLVRMGDRFYVIDGEGKLYSSKDGKQWNVKATSLPVTSLLGTFRSGKKQEDILTVILKSNEGKLIFAALDESGTIKDKEGAYEEVPASFPLLDYTSAAYYSMHFERLLLGGGIDSNSDLQGSMWTTLDGFSWAVVTNEKYDFLSVRGATMVLYDDMFYLIGGMDADGKPVGKSYLSKDNGVHWVKISELQVLPLEYTYRAYSTAVVDKDNYLMIFGGKTSDANIHLDEVWRGRVNRLGFKEK